MKLALVTSSAPFGKGESFVITEANALSDAGIQILMVPTVMRAGSINQANLRPAIRLAAHRLLSLEILIACLRIIASKPLTVLSALWALRCRSLVTFIKNLAVFPKAIWLAEKIKLEGINHIHAQWVSTPSTIAMVASLISGIPWSCTAHRGDIVANNLLCQKLSQARFMRFISESGLALAKVKCSSFQGKAKLLHMGVNVPHSHNKITKKNPLTVLCPANLIPVKGHRFLIEAWSLLPSELSAKLLLAGDGELRDALQAHVAKLNLEPSVEFLGHVPHSELLSMYERGEIALVVLPSLDLGDGLHEGIPVSLMEAMAYGIPVISTATGGIPELLHDGAGIVVPHANSEALADAIVALLNDQDFALVQGTQGQVRIIEQFNSQTIAETLIEWFTKHGFKH